MDEESIRAVFEKTDLAQKDSLQLWTYTLTMNYPEDVKGSAKSLAVIEFIRTKLTTDTTSMPEFIRNGYKYKNDSLGLLKFEIELTKDRNKYTRHSTPRISYSVYKIEDTSSLFKGYKIWQISSCVAPNIGGDYFIIGKFIFLNQSACVTCSGNSPNTDICRPVINYIFSKITNNFSTIQSIVNQFPIKENKARE